MAAMSIVGGTAWWASITQSTPSNSTTTDQLDVQLAEAAAVKAADPDVIAQAGQIERELAGGFVELQRAIQQADRGAFFLHEADRWDRELNAIEQDLGRIESYDN
jgi:hypothetical protein